MSVAPSTEPLEEKPTSCAVTAGQVITFYSYKGGVGRSMAVANVATLLAQAGKKVLAIDFDFEAPGLHRYFSSATEASLKGDQPGMIELLHQLQTELDDASIEPVPAEDEAFAKLPPPLRNQQRKAAQAARARAVVSRVLESGAFFRKAAVVNPNGSELAHVDLMTAGRFDDEYPNRVRSFDWAGFYAHHPFAYRAIASVLSRRYDYVIVDSRTGITDVGSVCTVLLPEKLVLVFAPNEQSLNGAVQVGRQAVVGRKKSSDMRALPIFPLMSRVENAEDALQRQWIADARKRFEALFREVYGLESCELSAYFDAVRVPHKSKYAYGEQVAAEHQRSTEDGSLASAYQQLALALQCNNVTDAQPHLLSTRILPTNAQAVAAVAVTRAREAEARVVEIDNIKKQLEDQLAELSAPKRVVTIGNVVTIAALVLLVVAMGYGIKKAIFEPAAQLDPLESCLAPRLSNISPEQRRELFVELAGERLGLPPPVGGAVYRTSQDPALASALATCRGEIGQKFVGFEAPFRVLLADQAVPDAKVALQGEAACLSNGAGECTVVATKAPIAGSVVVTLPGKPPTTVTLEQPLEGRAVLRLPSEAPALAPVVQQLAPVPELPVVPPGALALDARGAHMARAVVNTISTFDPNVDFFISRLRTSGPEKVAANQLLNRLVRRYAASNGKYASDVQSFLPGSQQKAVVPDEEAFAAVLAQAANDPVMLGLSTALLNEQFWTPAMERAGEIGLKTPLSASVLYDTALYGLPKLETAIETTTKQMGGTVVTGVDEKKWTEAFLKHRGVREGSKPIFLELIAQGNWELRDPVQVRKRTIPTPKVDDRSAAPR